MAAFVVIVSTAQAQEVDGGAAGDVESTEATPASAAPETTPAETPPPAQDDLVGELFALETQLLDMVYSASQVSEPVREAPVPVTIITREMIEESGARNLLELLTLYVPGFTRAEDHNELNFAMRGIYGSSQQKVLVLMDGHRLNSRAYSAAAPDFSIGLDKLKRIEVLRGPGSSIYGNVALTGVINLVTEDGKDVRGVRARIGAGDYGQFTASVFGGHDFGENGDFAVWGSFYTALGERVPVFANPPNGDVTQQNYSGSGQDGFALVGGARDPASYEFGAKVRYGAFHVMFDRRFGKHTEPLTAAGVTGEAYQFDAQTKNLYLGFGPGLGQSSTHAEVGWTDSFLDKKQLTFSATLYGDTQEVQGVTTTNANGGAILIGWNDQNVGAIVNGRYDYKLGGKLGSGSITLGGQWEYMRVIDSLYSVAANTVWTSHLDQTQPLLEPGREIIYSGYLMARHRFFDALVVNVGGRYDHKIRKEGPDIDNFSPRIALALAPEKAFWDVRLSYARSFIDAPYWYRYNSLPSYRGSRNLVPENLESVQLTGSVSLLDDRLKGTLNLFYNNLTDFIFRNNSAGPTDPIYQNAGYLQSVGTELEAAWVDKWLHTRGTLTWQGAVAGRDYGNAGLSIYNVPNWSGSLTADVAPLFVWTDKVWLHAAMRYMGRTLSPVNLTFRDAMGNELARFNEPNRNIEGAAIVDVGLRVKDLPWKNVFVQGTIYNLLNTRQLIGGSVVHPYPQTGRWFLVTIGYTVQ